MRVVTPQRWMFLVLGMIVAPNFAYAAADMAFSPDVGTFGVGKTFTVNVVVDSGADKFNSANAQISFDKDILSVQSVSKTSSAFSLWAVEPSSSNAQGTVSFEGGNTSALSGKKTLLSITFKGLKEGKASVRFASASVLAADGKGTDIAGAKKEASFDIAAGAVDPSPPPPPAPVAPVIDTPVPEAPLVQSTTHPDENVWSSSPKARFTWELPDDVTAIRLAFDTKEKTAPTTGYDPPIPDKEFEALQNGTMYFHIRFRNDGGWGGTTHRKLMVDTMPPEQFDLTAAVDASSTGAVLLTFSATDTLSGIDRYEILVDDGNPTKVLLKDLKPTGYPLTGVASGEHTITVKAYDKAGNSTSAEAKATVIGEDATQAKPVEEEEEKPTDWALIRQIILIAILAFLIGYLVYERRAFSHEKYLAKREADELRDEMASVFAALREEVGEQVGTLFQKPNPSARDREVMGKINEAVDLSEEILAKEVEDVRKYLM